MRALSPAIGRLQQIVASLARWLANLARIGWKWMRHKMTPPATSACLDAFLAEFARGIQIADSKRPRKTTGKGTTYQEGIGPFTENETVKLVLNEFPKDWKGCKLEPLVPFPSSPRRKCDLRIVAPSGKLYIEIKMMRLLGDNGKTNDNIAMHILSPYPQQRSALTDIQKLKESGFDGDKAIVIYGYDYDEYPLSLMMDYFETLAGHRLRPRARPRSTGWFTPFIDEARSTAGCLLEPRRASRRASRSTDRPHVGIDTRRDLLERHLHRLLRKMGIPARRLRLVVTEHIAEHRQAHAERERLRGAIVPQILYPTAVRTGVARKSQPTPYDPAAAWRHPPAGVVSYPATNSEVRRSRGSSHVLAGLSMGGARSHRCGVDQTCRYEGPRPPRRWRWRMRVNSEPKALSHAWHAVTTLPLSRAHERTENCTESALVAPQWLPRTKRKPSTTLARRAQPTTVSLRRRRKACRNELARTLGVRVRNMFWMLPPDESVGTWYEHRHQRN